MLLLFILLSFYLSNKFFMGLGSKQVLNQLILSKLFFWESCLDLAWTALRIQRETNTPVDYQFVM